jgi:hypothetical protein
VKEILAASERAFRSARSVQVKLTFKDRAGVVKANLTLTRSRAWRRDGSSSKAFG